jgi:hypothetical protein
MTGFQHPDTLRQHRPLLLACEAIGWLHMAGKAKSISCGRTVPEEQL